MIVNINKNHISVTKKLKVVKLRFHDQKTNRRVEMTNSYAHIKSNNFAPITK